MSAGAPRTLHALVAGLVDYAGLFPPAALGMREAAEAYTGYLASPERWMLGRFVVPVARLDELAVAAPRAVTERWCLSALAATDPEADVRRVHAFGAAHGGRLTIDTVEAKAATTAAVAQAVRAVGDAAILYLEIPVHDDPRALLEAIRDGRARAKVRTGGLTPDAFPEAGHLARFITRCAELGVPWKATAGLHHPLRAEHRLTYADDAPCGTMYGFLNVFAAGAFALAGLRESALVRLLEERDPAALAFDDTHLRWRGHAIALDQITEARASFAIAFGSCSFREPVDDLHAMRLL